MLAGAFISGKSYAEYCQGISEEMPLTDDKGQKIKGAQSVKTMTLECEAKTEKHLSIIKYMLIHEASVFKMALDEIDKIEWLVSAIILLSPKGRDRMQGLLTKLKKDPEEIKFWQEFEEDYNLQNEATKRNSPQI